MDIKESTLNEVLVVHDELIKALTDYIYVVDNFPYDDDYLDIVTARCSDIMTNLPYIKKHIRSHLLKLEAS